MRRFFLAKSQINFQNHVINKLSLSNDQIFQKFHLTSVIKNLITETQITFDIFSNSFFELLAELSLLIVLLIVIAFQFNLDFYFIYILLIITLLYLFYKTSKKFLNRLGTERSKALNNINKTINQFINLFNNLKFMNKMELYKINLNKFTQEYAYVSSKFLFTRAVPKYFIEMVFILVLLFIVLSIQNVNGNINYIILVGIIFVRLFPSFIRIKTNIDNIIFSRQAVKNLFLFKDYVEKNSQDKYNIIYDLKFKKKITFENINFSYHKNSHIFLNSNFQIFKNKVTGVIGKSGSGKSTLLRIISGLENPENMILNVDDIELKNLNKRPSLDIVFQDLYLPSGRYLDFFKNLNKIKLKQLKTNFSLLGLDKELGKIEHLNLTDNGANLSQGQKQRLCILRSLSNSPDLLIFDEPSSNIDFENINKLKQIFKFLRNKISIIIVTHDHNLYDLFDYCYTIKNNNLISLKKYEYKNR